MNANQVLLALTDAGVYLYPAQHPETGAQGLRPSAAVPADLAPHITAQKAQITALLRGASVPALEHRLARGLDGLLEMETGDLNDETFIATLAGWQRMLDLYKQQVDSERTGS